MLCEWLSNIIPARNRHGMWTTLKKVQEHDRRMLYRCAGVILKLIADGTIRNVEFRLDRRNPSPNVLLTGPHFEYTWSAPDVGDGTYHDELDVVLKYTRRYSRKDMLRVMQDLCARAEFEPHLNLAFENSGERGSIWRTREAVVLKMMP